MSALDDLRDKLELARVLVPAHDRTNPKTHNVEHVRAYSYERHGKVASVPDYLAGRAKRAKAGQNKSAAPDANWVSPDLLAKLKTPAPAVAKPVPAPAKPSPARQDVPPAKPGKPKLFGSLYRERIKAQDVAERAWREDHGQSFEDGVDDVLYDSPSPIRSWGMYQVEGGYEAINGYLRSGLDTGFKGESSKQLSDDMIKAFDTMGYKTEQDGTVYRTVDDHVPLSSFKPGGTFTDKGVISTATSTDDIGNFLAYQALDAHLESAKLKHSLLQINVPKGTQVLGGTTSGFELMLKPGTKFKVVSVSGKRSVGGEAAWPYPKVKLPTITLEVQP